MALLTKIGPVGRFLMFWKLFRDPRVPWWSKALFVVATLGYFFFPFDLVPDFFLGVGWIDDLVLTPIFAWVSAELLPRLLGQKRPAGV